MMRDAGQALTPDGETLLELWEGARAQPASTRADALLQPFGCRPGPACLPGERNAMLAGLHAQLFGRTLDLVSHCPACATVVEFSADCQVLGAQAAPRARAGPHSFETHGHAIEFRMPDDADIAQCAAAGEDPDCFARLLLERCVLGCRREGAAVATAALPPEVLDALSVHMETLDPGASLSFALACPQCQARWQAPLDIGDALWQKVQAAAERLLLDIDLLARSYGWTESEVLRLSPLRRAAYLQMVTP
jgi:hypothetical protein